MSNGRLTARQKQAVLELAHGYCEYCCSPANYCPDPFAIEHIQPRAAAGTNESDNLAFSCQGCNGHKGISTTAIDPATGEAVPLFHPRQQQWADHFSWSEDFTRIIGLTPTGRATVEKLKLNRESVINLRRVLYVAGIHPPADSP